MTEFLPIVGGISALFGIIAGLWKAGSWLLPRIAKRHLDYKFSRLPLKERLIRQGIPAASAEYAINVKGLTDEDVKWNIILNRPLNWKETVHPAEELKRRADYQRRHRR